MKKFLSLFLAFLLIFSLSVSALADETDGDSGGSSEVSPAAPAETSPPAPAPDPVPAPSPDPDPPSVSSAPEPDPPPSQDIDSDIGQAPSPALPENPAESGGSSVPVENPSLDVADSGISSVAGDLGELPFDVTTMPNGDIIIEEHSYTRTVDILDTSFFDDLPTMRSVLVSIFGEYTPKTQSVSTYYDGQLMESSTEYVPGIAGMDMEWIAGVIVFTVLLFCLMKFLGGVFK